MYLGLQKQNSLNTVTFTQFIPKRRLDPTIKSLNDIAELITRIIALLFAP